MNCSKTERLFLGVADDNNSATAILGDSQGRVIARNVSGSVNYVRYGISQARRNLEELILGSLGCKTENVLDTVCFTYKSQQILDVYHLNCLVQGLLEKTNIQMSDFRSATILGLPKGRAQMLVIGGESSYVLFRCQSGLRYELKHPCSSWDIAVRTWDRIKKNPNTYGSQELHELFFHFSTALNYGQTLKIAQHVNEFAEMGNPIALEVLCDAADDLIHLIVQMIRYMDVSDPYIGLYGPVFLGSEIIYHRIKKVIRLLVPEAQIMMAPHAPAKGAYLASLKGRKFNGNSEKVNIMPTSSYRSFEREC
jgi:hypothetical protein